MAVVVGGGGWSGGGGCRWWLAGGWLAAWLAGGGWLAGWLDCWHCAQVPILVAKLCIRYHRIRKLGSMDAMQRGVVAVRGSGR